VLFVATAPVGVLLLLLLTDSEFSVGTEMTLGMVITGVDVLVVFNNSEIDVRRGVQSHTIIMVASLCFFRQLDGMSHW
jgi:hypothetical protein